MFCIFGERLRLFFVFFGAANVVLLTAGFTTVAISVKPVPSCVPGSQFYTTGGTNNFVVPTACTSIAVKAWGAGGGSAVSDEPGGGGGFADAIYIAVTPGETLTVNVGGGGFAVDNGGAGGTNGGGAGDGGGGGGGYSGILRSGTPLLIAAGGGGSGGGAAGNANATKGGAGGGSTGTTGGAEGTQTPGGGGTQVAGGAAGGGTATAGSSLQGGIGAASKGGGGGGGYFGGGGGKSTTTQGAGGGGGSSYVPAESGYTKAGSTLNPGNNTDADYSAPAGVGGQGTGSNGNPGRIVIRWPSACTSGAIGAICNGGAIYAGFVGSSKRIMVTPSKCNDSATPSCPGGGTDTLQKAFGPNSTTAGTTSATDGQANTTTQVGLGAGYTGAHYCNNMVFASYSDWYLGARDEMVAVFNNAAAAAPGWHGVSYLTSTETNSTTYVNINMTDGTYSTGGLKGGGTRYIRCIRSF